MPKEPRISLSPFPGMVSNADPSDIPNGASQFQENVQSLIQGQLNVRKGNVRASFLNGSAAGTSDTIAIFNYHRPAGDSILFETATGSVRMGRGAAVMVVATAALTGAPTIATGFNTFRKLCFAKYRKGDVFAFNGVDRGIRWDGITTAAEQAGITAPTAGPTLTSPIGGACSAGSYYCAYRFVDNTLPTPVVSSLSPQTLETAAANDQIQWSAIQVSAEPRVTHVQLWRSAVGAAAHNKLYYVATITNGTTTYASDAASDATRIAAAAADFTLSLFVLYPNGQLCGRRQEPPPNFKHTAVVHQDRLYFMGDVNYTTGTITTNGTTALVGSGTAWTSAMVGRYIYINSEILPLVVSVVTDATHITTTAAASTSTAGLAYVMRPNPVYRNAILFSEPDEFESVPSAQNIITVQQSGGNDEDECVGGMPFGAILYPLYDRHIYTVSSYSQPVLDADVKLLANRGACCQRCWDIHEGVAYLMDAAGMYTMTPGGAITPISAAVQNYFRDHVDLSKKDTFHVTADPALEVVRFFVSFTGDTSTRPKRAFVYHVRTKNWWLENYHCEMGDSGRTEISSKLRAITGGEDESIYFMDEGYTDGVPSQYRGTATAGTATTLTDSTASFGADVVGAPVAIVSGPGKGQSSIVTAKTNTELTVASWSIATPTSQSVYVVGGIAWSYLSGQLGVTPNPEFNLRGVEVVFEPTSGAASLDVRRYWNADSTPENNVMAESIPQGANPLVTATAADPNHVVNLKLARGDSNSSGHALCPFSGRRFDRFEAKQDLTIEMRGFQGNDNIIIYDAQILGVE